MKACICNYGLTNVIEVYSLHHLLCYTIDSDMNTATYVTIIHSSTLLMCCLTHHSLRIVPLSVSFDM